MIFAYYIKKRALQEDASIAELLSALRQRGHETYNVMEGLRPGATDMLLSFGGDGTLLSAAVAAGPMGIPVLGVNLGRLGFLSETPIQDVLRLIDSSSYEIEERDMLQVSVEGVLPQNFCPFALNEAALQRTGAGALGIEVSIAGNQLPTYWADGLIVSSSSGSTAYSLSVGGPICMPEVRAYVVAPIAPHNLNVRPLVVPEGSPVTMCARENDKNHFVRLSLDNRDYQIPAGTKVTVGPAPFALRRVVASKSSFFKALRTKLFWGEDVRNSQ